MERIKVRKKLIAYHPRSGVSKEFTSILVNIFHVVILNFIDSHIYRQTDITTYEQTDWNK